MNEEDAFQTVLDENREDHTTRLALADWLMERDDPRGPGYRALGLLGKRTDRWIVRADCDSAYWDASQWDSKHGPDDVMWKVSLPSAWWQLLPRSAQCSGGTKSTKNKLTRREAEDAAALAFGKLSPRAQEEILSQVGAKV